MYLADGVFKNLGHGHVDADDRIIYDPAKGELYYDADGSGAEQAQLIATFTGHNPVYETNFFVYL
jgi:Ca2+-binding RTX toxin-like protein